VLRSFEIQSDYKYNPITKKFRSGLKKHPFPHDDLTSKRTGASFEDDEPGKNRNEQPEISIQ